MYLRMYLLLLTFIKRIWKFILNATREIVLGILSKTTK